MASLKYFFYLCLIIASTKQAIAEESSIEVSVKQLNVALGGTGSVTCTPRGSPLPQVQWSKHGGQFGPETKQTGNTLLISNAQVGDQGYYLCSGIVDRKIVIQQFILVEVKDVQPPVTSPQSQPPVRVHQPQIQNAGNPRVKVSARQLIITRGQSGTIDCIPEGSPLPRIQWSKEEGEFNSRVTPIGKSLVISNAQDGDGGHYICNGLVNATTVWTEFVQVEIVPGQLSEPLDASVAESQNIIISCDLKTRDDQQIVSWSDQRSLPQNVQQNDRELIFQRATNEKAAEYLCKVTGGFSLRQLYLRLDAVPTLPRVITRPERQTVTRGQSFKMECAVAEGNAQVSWERVDGAFSSRVEHRGAQLVFRNIEVEDGGSYRCIARNKAGETTQTTEIVVTDVPQPPQASRPRVTVNVRQLKIARGESRTVVCTPEGSPLPKVLWSKGEGKFGNGVRQNGTKLTITDAQDGDAGDYVCTGIVEATPVWTDYLQVVIEDVPPRQPQASPKVTVNVRQLTIPRGESGTVDCNPEGSPLPRVQWSKEEGKFSNGVRQNGTKLIITNAQDGDAGDYVCTGIVEATPVWTDYLQVVIKDVPPPPHARPRVTVNVRLLTITRGESRTVDCNPEGSPLPRVQWSKEEGKFSNGVRQNGTKLIITNAQDGDAGDYVCTGIVEATPVWTDYLQVVIKGMPPPPHASPRVTVNVRQLTITRGESRTVDCNPEGSPLPRVQWSKEEGKFSNGVRQNGTKLIITNAQDGDTGNYVCTGIVEATPVWTDYLQVVIKGVPPPPHASPRVTVNVRQLTITRGESRTVDCNPEGSPLPRVQWSKGQGKFGNGVRQNGTKLTITNAQDGDAGDYMCTGIVEARPVWADYLQVVIKDVPPPTPDASPKVTVNVRYLTILRGENRTVDCTPSGSPLPRVQWSKEDGQFSNSVRQDGNALIITNAQVGDAGDYVCTGIGIVETTPVWKDYLQVMIEDAFLTTGVDAE